LEEKITRPRKRGKPKLCGKNGQENKKTDGKKKNTGEGSGSKNHRAVGGAAVLRRAKKRRPPHGRNGSLWEEEE